MKRITAPSADPEAFSPNALGELYLRTARELPAGWTLQGLRCTSEGLRPEQRVDAWLAEACGPRGRCVKFEAPSPVEALLAVSSGVRQMRA